MDLFEFLDQSVSPYHTAQAARHALLAAGFEEVQAATSQAPGRYFTLRGGKSLFAWIHPEGAAPDAFQIVSAHTDFPALRVKTEPFFARHGSRFISAHPYDGPNVASWIDRDLGLAGLVYTNGDAGVEASLIRSPLTCRTIGVPTHMRAENSGPNPQTDLHGFIGADRGQSKEENWALVLEGTGVTGTPIEHELFLHDRAEASSFGEAAAYVSGGRLDNLISCHSALSALIASKDATLPHVPMVALFDAEEIGSGTWLGAKSPLLERILRQIAGDRFEAMVERSAQISLDVAHAVNPLSPELFDSTDGPRAGSGPVTKYGTRGNYTYNAHLMAQIRRLATRAEIALQSFTYRADRGQGGSLGPHSSTALAIRSVDIGVPIFAMHSIREACARSDIDDTTRLMEAFLSEPCGFADSVSD